MLFSLFNLTALLILTVVRGQYTNLTVDDGDGSITYAGNWGLTKATPLDYPFQPDGEHHLCGTAVNSCTATFTFTGVAVYYWSPLWPYLVNSMLSLDGAPGECVDMTDPSHSGGQEETVQSMPIWGKTGLANTKHTLVVSSCVNGPYVVVDAFTYTIQTPSGSTSTSPSTSTLTLTSTSSFPFTIPVVSSTSSSTSSSSSSTTTPVSGTRTRTIAIAVGGAVGGVVILAIFILALFFCFQRRRVHAQSSATQRASSWASNAGVPGPPPMSNTSLQPGFRPAQQNIPFNSLNPPNNQYNPNAPYSHWTPSSPGSYYPKSLTPISEGSPPSDVSRRPHLPEL